MLDIAYKNIGRQRTRSFLTILGILIGIAAIVALGSAAEGIDALVQTSMEKMAGKIMVFEKGSVMMMGYAGSEISDETVSEIAEVSGVKEAIPIAFHILEMEGLQFRQPETVMGMPPGKIDYFKGERVEMYEGRQLEEGDTEVVIIGKDIAEMHSFGVGDDYDIEDESFPIVGVIEKTDDPDIDMGILIDLDTLREIVELEGEVPVVFAVPEDLGATELVAENIEDTFEDLNAITDVELTRQVGDLVNNIRFFTLGIAAIAAIVGGLGVMNTMIMAVLERRREIGVMKALGATRRMIMTHFLTEAALLAGIGGIGGVAIGTLLAFAVGTFSGFAITPIVTPTLALVAFLFAIILGLLGGFYPARKAAKLDAVEALRYE